MESALLSRAEIEHYKSLSNINIDFDKLTVFVGRNSVGKSNIIESILFVRDCLNRGIDSATSDRHGIDSILQWSRYRPFNLDIRLSYKGEGAVGGFTLKVGSKNREPVILSESGYWKDIESSTRISYKRESDRIELEGFDSDVERIFAGNDAVVDHDNLFLRQIQYIPLRSYRLTSALVASVSSVNSYSIFPNTLRDPQKPSSENMLSQNGDNLTSILRNMASSKASRTRARYIEIISMMKKVIPNLERILIRTLSGLLWLNFEVSENDGRMHQLNVSQVSDGALRILGILVALYQPNPPRTIAIEEPEQNLHPGALGLLADAFADRSGDTQVILTTHSPHLIDHFSVENLRHVYIDEATSTSNVVPIMGSQRDAIKEGLLTAGEIMASQGFKAEGRI